MRLIIQILLSIVLAFGSLVCFGNTHFYINQLFSKKADKRLEAAQALQGEDGHYAEAVEALIKALFAKSNISKLQRAPATYLNAVLDALMVHGNSQYTDRLRDYRIQVDDTEPEWFGGVQSKIAFTGKLSRLIDALEQREEGLPRLNPERKTSDREDLIDLQKQLSEKGMAQLAKMLNKAVVNSLTGIVKAKRNRGDDSMIEGRDALIRNTMQAFASEKGTTVGLLGPAGSGKSTIALGVAESIVDRNYPDSDYWQAQFENALVFEVTPASLEAIGRGPEGVENWCLAVEEIESTLGVPIITFIDEYHTIAKSQLEAFKAFLDSPGSGRFRLLVSTTSEEYVQRMKTNPAARRRVVLFGVEEFDEEKTFELLTQHWIPKIEDRHGVVFDEDALRAINRGGQLLFKDGGRLDAGIKLASHLAASVDWQVSSGDRASKQVEKTDFEAFMQDRLGFPVNPLNPKSIADYEVWLKARLNEEVIDQPQMVDTLVETWIDLLLDPKRKVRVVMIPGPTGVGKSEITKAFAKVVFNNPRAHLTISGTEYKDESAATLSRLFGAAPGLISSNDFSGTFIEFIDDPGRGMNGGIVTVDEFEHGSTNFHDRFKEIFSDGVTSGGDGNQRKLFNMMFVLTTNQGDSLLFPEGFSEWSQEHKLEYFKSFDHEFLLSLLQAKKDGHSKQALHDSYLARIDEVVPGFPLSRKSLQGIAAQKISTFLKTTDEQFDGIRIVFPENIAEHFASHFYNPRRGARPLVRGLSRWLRSARNRLLQGLDPAQGELVESTLEEIDQTTYLVARTVGSNKEVKILVPSNKHDIPMLNRDLNQRLQAMPGILNEMVLGQEEAVERTIDAVFSFYLTPESKRRGPLVLGWFGSTGIGKTELAKALAKALYGSSDRLATISMGSISRAEQLNNIFGSSAGFVGSLEVREFEKSLRKNPNGGVVAFDEFSNVGGNNKAEKDAIGKRFYELFEGKTWTSPVTGKEYDLTKYVFTLQGNDGEESFQDYQSEDMRMTIWKELKNSEAIRRILRERGFSEALIGRIADISLFKPTQAETNTKIVEKFLRIELEEFRSLGVDVQFDEAFAQKLTDIFFSYREGNRSVRKIIEKQIKGNVGKILSSALVENPNLDTANVKFSLDISDSFLGKYIIDAENRYEERKVILSIRSSLLQQDSNIDLTMQAVNCRLMTSEQARLVAAHEAGHAILNEPEVSGQRVAYVTIRGDGNLGYARYEDLPGGSNNHTVKSMLFALARLVAGQAGVAAVGKSEETGWSSDLSTARKLAYRVLISNGLLEPFLGIIHSDKKDSSHLSDTKREAVEDIITAYLKVSRELAAKVIQRNKGIFDRIADRLFQKGFMTGDDYQLMSDGRQGVTDEDYKEAEKQINDLLVPITQRLANSQPL